MSERRGFWGRAFELCNATDNSRRHGRSSDAQVALRSQLGLTTTRWWTLTVEELVQMMVWRERIPVRVLLNATDKRSPGHTSGPDAIDPIGVWHTNNLWSVFGWRLVGKARDALGLAPQVAWRRL